MREGVFSQNLKIVELSKKGNKAEGSKVERILDTAKYKWKGVWQHERIVRENNNLG